MEVGLRCRHIVILRDGKQWPAEVLHESVLFYETRHGLFGKASRTRLGEPDVTFIGPYNENGCLE